VWVGHTTEDPAYFAGSADAYFSTPRTRAELVAPFRYLLEPSGALDAIGPMVFAAAVGDDPDDARLPFRLAGFAVADTAMDFADGEVRVVTLALTPPDGVVGTIDDACIVWGVDTAEPSRIGPSDDLDCDGAIGAGDCDDLDPSKNNLDRDGDDVTSCAGDCMDDPRSDAPWIDPATVHPGAPDPEENDPNVCDHIDDDCDGFCIDPAEDRDGSQATECGGIKATGGVCTVLPADCDRDAPGQQPLLGAAPEACNGRDDACDGFLPPRLPCLIRNSTTCAFGEVKCDEVRGEYDGEPGDLACKHLPDGFSDVPAPPGLCTATAPASCLEAGDPVGCGFTGMAVPRGACRVTSAPTCPPDRSLLELPGLVLPQVCAWHIVGGVQQAEWEVGFVPANAPPGAPPMATITECSPHLAARAKVANPSPRTVLLLLMAPQNPNGGVRPVVIQLDSDANGGEPCVGDLVCQFSPGV